MKTGDKVRLIRKTATMLSQLDWGDIDLILRQFGFDWSYDWPNTDKYGYSLHHLEKSSDYESKIVELHEFLNSKDKDIEESLAILTGPWAPHRFKLFISHISEDRDKANELKEKLALYGVDAFVAHADIKPTTEWQDEIEKALDSCDAVIAILTETFHESPWTDQEIGYCLKRRVLIIPLCVDINPYGFMGKYQGIKCKGQDASTIAATIFETLINRDLTSQQMAAGLVGYIEETPSWLEANRRSGLLLRVKLWPPELLRRLEDALDRNSEISGSFNAPSRIRQIVSLHKGK